MKIEKIYKIKGDFYKITVLKEDETIEFKISEDFIIQYQLYRNKILSDEDFLMLYTLSNQSKIYVQVLKFLSYKMRTEYEVAVYLKEKGCLEPYLTNILNKLKKLNYINDQKYCELYVKNQFEMNKKGPYLIKEELLKKKVESFLINKFLLKLTQEKIQDNILKLIKHYEKLNKNKPVKKLKESILRNLIAKGYTYEDIHSVINHYSFEQVDQSILEKEVNKVYRKLSKKYLGFELKNRMIKSLLSKGFIYEDITQALGSFDMEG